MAPFGHTVRWMPLLRQINSRPFLSVNLEMRRLLDFLHSLTDRRYLDMRSLVPKTVLGGILVFD